MPRTSVTCFSLPASTACGAVVAKGAGLALSVADVSHLQGGATYEYSSSSRALAMATHNSSYKLKRQLGPTLFWLLMSNNTAVGCRSLYIYDQKYSQSL